MIHDKVDCFKKSLAGSEEEMYSWKIKLLSATFSLFILIIFKDTDSNSGIHTIFNNLVATSKPYTSESSHAVSFRAEDPQFWSQQ